MRSLLAIAIVLLTARAARAYPHFQLSSGSMQCMQCHYAPAGGGLLTAWGQEESGDTLAHLGGDGRFLHGAIELPESIAIGGDLRAAALANETGSSEGVELAAFPMQADVAARVAFGDFSVTATVGARGAVRSGSPDTTGDAGDATSPSLRSYVISREHFAMWQADRDTGGPYVRAGRFAAPYGLRLADHTAYVRRYLGYNLLEETYGLGAGIIGSTYELHATGFIYDPLQGATRKELGGALLFETQVSPLLFGISARAGKSPDDTRMQAGLHIKAWIEGARLLLQGELDGVRQNFEAGGQRDQIAAYAGPVVIPMRGLYTGLAYEAFAEDLQVRGVLRQAIAAWASYFPRAHWEIMLSGRGQRIGPREHAVVTMLQLHYIL